MNDHDVITVEVEWKVECLDALSLDSHQDLKATVTVTSDSEDAQIKVSGPRREVAEWVLIEHYGGDVDSANELLKTATLVMPVVGCCSRCGAGQVSTHAPLCGGCDTEVTSVQALDILSAKMGPQTMVANPRRTRV